MAAKREPFYSYRTFLRNTYGKNLYRIPVNLNFSCPNRDEDGRGGCTFCGENGALAVHLNINTTDLVRQVQESIDYTRKRYGADCELMIYFQAYTSTNAPIEQIRDCFEKVLALADFKAIIVSTRPDCLPEDVLTYFKELTERYDLWVELGIQTANDTTLKRINRGHDFACSATAIKVLDECGVKVTAHVILGLPGETKSDFENTAETLAKLPISGIKIHNLHIVKNTALAKENIPVFDEHEYAEVLIDFLRRIPANIPVMRICSDTPNEILIAPIWWMKKGQFLNYVHHQMKQRSIFQGDLVENSEFKPEAIHSYKVVETDDGSCTFYSDFFKENYHSTSGAKTESVEKFIQPTNLFTKLEGQKIRLLDVGFGLGCNALTAFFSAPEQSQLDIVTLEFDRAVVEQAINAFPEWATAYTNLLAKGYYQQGNRSIKIIWGDARKNLKQLRLENQQFDIIFHDAFSTQKNTELWTQSFFRSEAILLKTGGQIVTYSNANPVRSALYRCGLTISETPAVGRKKGGTLATKSLAPEIELSEKEQLILTKTTSMIPYRDPCGTWSRKQILLHRDRVVKRFIQLGIPKKIK